MRTVVITIFMIALVVAGWLAARPARNTEPLVDPSSSIPIDAVGTENHAAAHELERQADSAPVNSRATTATDKPATGREIRTPYDEPEFREALVRSLVQNGLSTTDAERVAGAAFEGLTECIATAGIDAARASVIETCDSNMWQQAGLSKDVHRRAIMAAAGRELSRRRSLEAAAAAAAR